MKIRKECLGLLLAATFLILQLMGSNALAQNKTSPRSNRVNTSSSYGPESKRFGAGLYLGEPTGFTLKGYVNERVSIDGIAAWGLYHDAFTLIGDVTSELFDIPIDSSSVTLPFYAGIGGKMEFRKHRDDVIAGIRVPIGLSLQWTHFPIEVFVEIVPGMNVVPSTDFDLMGGMGARFYF